jgi:hypothetical protein
VKGSFRFNRRVLFVAVLLAGSGSVLAHPFQGHAGAARTAPVTPGHPTPSVRVADLENHLVDPFQVSADAKAIVFVFTSVDCPISNRYAPVIAKLHETFASKGVEFWMIYPNPFDAPDAIRKHLKDFSLPTRALRDPDHALAKIAHATVTPEAAVYDRQGHELYHGRIDDRYVNLGLERPAPTKRDLQDALTATLAGKAVPETSTQAVGCYIADFVR